MATTFSDYNAPATYSFTFPSYQSSDVKVRVDGVLKTAGNHYNITGYTTTGGGTVVFTSGNVPSSPSKVRIYRDTNVEAAKATFTAGSSVKAADLNNNATQLLYRAQEEQVPNLIHSWDIADQSIETSDIKDGAVTTAKIAADNITSALIADDQINSEHYVDRSIDTQHIGLDQITNALIADNQIDSEHYVDGSIDHVHLANDVIDGDNIQNDVINSEHYVAGSIDTEHIADSQITTAKIANTNVTTDKLANSSVTTVKIANNNVTTSKLADDAVTADKLASNSVVSASIVNDSIVDADINTSAAIAGTKITPAFGTQNISTTGTLVSGAQTVTGNIAVSGTVDGRDVAADGTKLDGIETGATGDQTAGEIRALVEAANDSNVFTDADHTKLNGIETGATADQTNAEIKTAYEANADTNEFSDAEQSKLAGIETAATADQTAAEIKTLLQSDKLTLSEINTTSTDSRYFTETELTNGALDGRYYTETEAEARFLRQDSSENINSGMTWSNSDSFVATTAAINARILDLVDDVGGFTAIASEQHFPNTNPQGTTGQAAILSIQAATTTLTPSGTTLTISNGNLANNANITITGVTATIPSGFGFLVESTSTLHTYSFHRLVPVATQVATVANNITNIVNAGINVADINNFADLYIISSSEPTQRNDGTSLQEGDLWYDSSNDNLLVYTGSAFSIITPSQSVLDDVAIVSGAITYSEDLGLITNAVSTGNSNGSLDIVADALEDEITFTVTVINSGGNKYVIDGDTSNPAKALTLYKGWTYTFDQSDSSNANHPLVFKTDSGSYTTNVTVTGTAGQAGAKVQIVIPETQPTGNFRYYCSVHGNAMGNLITVKDDPIKTVSDNITGILAAANNNTNVSAVAANATNINAVAGNASNINSAVSNASNINAVVSNASNINAVAGNNSNITAVANNETNINAVQSNATNINAVAGNATNINAVAADAADIGAVAGKATEIGRLGTADAVADLAILGTSAIVSDMDTLADISSNITTVAGISSNVTTVAGNNSNVTAVAGNNSNITSVANNSSNINSAVSNASNINTVAGSISNVNTVSGSISNVNTVASNINNVNSFAGTYQIASSAPSTDGAGNALAAGDLYFDTTANELRVHNGSTFQGGVTATGNLAGLGANTFTGSQTINANIIVSGTVDGRDVSADGSKLDGIAAGAQVNVATNLSKSTTSTTNVIASSTGTNVTLNEATGSAAGLMSVTHHNKLDGIETGATADQTASEIVALISGQTIAPNVITTTNLTLDFGSIA